MNKTMGQIIKNALIAIGALAAFYLFVGINFKDWSLYQYIGAGMVTIIVILTIVRIWTVLKRNNTEGEEKMPKRSRKEQPVPEAITEFGGFGFPIGREFGAGSGSEIDFVSSIKRRIDGLTGFLKMGAEEITKQYQEISKMELDINKKAKELYEQWIRLRRMKQMIENMLRVQQIKRQQEPGQEYEG